MMKPEPSERASGCWRGLGWPGCWRGMKRRKNSSTSSSSMPGTCGTAPLRRTACVVLMLTTALPWSSTRRVKSGSSRTCAVATAQKAASHRVATALTTFILISPKPLLRSAIFDCIGDALHARGWRLAHHGHHVIGDFAGIDMDCAHACKPRAHWIAAAFERFDEYRDRGQAVGIHHLAGGTRLADAALELDHLVEAGQLAREAPAGETRRRGGRVLDAPFARGVPGAHHVARHPAEGELREAELLDLFAGCVERHRAQQHAGVDVGVKLVAVAQVVARAEHHRLAVVAGDAPGLAQADVVVPGERGDPLGQQRGKATLAAFDALFHLHQAAAGQVAAHGIAGAHDLARHAVHDLELFDVAAGVDQARDARSLAAAGVLVDEGAP